jgi:hypothetical protein
VQSALDCLSGSHEKVCDQGSTAADRIFAALSFFGGVRYDLERLVTQFQGNDEDLLIKQVSFPERHSIVDFLESQYGRLESLLVRDDPDQYDRCMASRSLLFSVYYVFVVQPDLLVHGWIERVVKLHQAILRVMAPGRGRESTANRLAILQKLDVSACPTRVQPGARSPFAYAVK